MTTRTYVSPGAFKQALEQRLRSSAETGAAFARKRQLLVFDRFLARIVAALDRNGLSDTTCTHRPIVNAEIGERERRAERCDPWDC